MKCPIEDRNENLDVFTTDWAPCASACAVAIHSQHPFITNPKALDDYFTGEFVRHPLIGDLIPVHVAKWVKPDFGTGAMLINPGHDVTDLEYARKIGLPIRFSLVPESFNGTPATWPSPPVTSGNAIKTGFCDGKPKNELIALYFNKLKEFGLVESHDDCQAGLWLICRLIESDAGTICVDAASRLRFSGQGTGFRRYDLKPSNILMTLASIEKTSNPTIVAPASEIAGDLLGVRLAYFDLHGESLHPGKIEIVQGVNESELRHHKYYRQAALLASKINEVSTPKKQLIEQIERFNAQHAALSQVVFPDAQDMQPTRLWKLAVQTKQSLFSEGFPRAFSRLYNLQKELCKIPIEELQYESGFQAYLLLAYIIMGTGKPDPTFDAQELYQQMG